MTENDHPMTETEKQFQRFLWINSPRCKTEQKKAGRRSFWQSMLSGNFRGARDTAEEARNKVRENPGSKARDFSHKV